MVTGPVIEGGGSSTLIRPATTSTSTVGTPASGGSTYPASGGTTSSIIGGSYLEVPGYGKVYVPVFGVSASSLSNSLGNPRDGGARQHKGTDIFANRGTRIVSAVGGTIVGWGNLGGTAGYGVKIRDRYGNVHRYLHMDPSMTRLNLRMGQSVQAGQLIGYVGNTGNAAGTSAHLHYSINEGGEGSGLADPVQFIRSGQVTFVDIPYGGTQQFGDGGYATPPTDYSKLYKVGTDIYAVYDVGEGDGNKIFYRVPQSTVNTSGATALTRPQWETLWKRNGWVDGGTGEIFSDLPPGTTFSQATQTMLMQAGIWGSSALNDPSVMAVVKEFMARPTMEPEEFQNRLRNTNWWRNHTDNQRQWNDKAPAQQEQDIMDQVGKLLGLWFTYVGEDIHSVMADMNGDGKVTSSDVRAANPQLYQWALDIASGKKTEIQATNEWIKNEADKNENSPWSRIVRDEDKAQNQFSVDIANQATQAMDLYRRYGFNLDDKKAKELGEKLAMNETNLHDIEESLKKQATALFPGLPAGMDVESYSQPYRETLSQLLEIADPGVLDKQVQQAMRGSTTLADFEQSIRKDARWQYTQNAKDEYTNRFSEVGRLMGFV